jgi:LmbE family N-acetylglucosaminyl deacetylase
MGRDVIVSTHFDDAALSLGGSLEEALLLTVRGGAPQDRQQTTGWDAGCGFASAEEAVVLRRLEDRVACRLLGWEPVHLDFADGQYGDHVDGDAVRAAVEQHLGPADVLWVPAGIGHVDHLHTRDALLPLLAARAPALGRLYADVPYVGTLGRRMPGRRSLALGRLAYRRIAGVRLEQKRAAVEAHASQVPSLRQGFPAFDQSLRVEAWWPLRDRDGAAEVAQL